MDKEREQIKHESFGMIRFGRVQGHQNFFGSDLEQNHYISLDVSEGEIHRDLSSENYFSRNNILRLRMTSNQFAELITSLNTGSGVPCTLEYVNSKKIESLKSVENRKEFVHRKFKERMKEFGDNLKPKSLELEELLKKPKLSKEDKKQVQWIVDKVVQEVNLNIPFFLKCFQEDADKVVQEAKSEVENAIMNKITSVGMEKSFKDGLLKLKE